jgi:hypothetical protein
MRKCLPELTSRVGKFIQQRRHYDNPQAKDSQNLALVLIQHLRFTFKLRHMQYIINNSYAHNFDNLRVLDEFLWTPYKEQKFQGDFLRN